MGTRAERLCCGPFRDVAREGAEEVNMIGDK